MESWKPVVGYEGYYEVSDTGNVRSVDRLTRSGRHCKGRTLSKSRVGSGYQRVVLSVDGTARHAYVHRLVADAFLPNEANKAEVNHKDGDKQNNAASNLEWVTHSENGLHSFRVLGRKTSRSMLGKPSPRRVLTDGQVRKIRSGEKSCYALAKEYGVSQKVVQNVRNGVSYRVPSDPSTTDTYKAF